MTGESSDDRDRRILKLWETLDTRHEGHLDVKGFQRGLKRMDHPLKNADGLLHEILEAVDTSGDGKIQFNEFYVFVERTEKELWQLFKTIDRDNSGHLDKEEIRHAFSRAGLTVPKWKLEQFFEHLDRDNDGIVTFEEWRDFLLFLPADTSNLRSALSYYATTGNLNPEGDVSINQFFEGSGTTRHFLTYFPPWVQDLIKSFLQSLIPAQQVAHLGREAPPHLMHMFPDHYAAHPHEPELEVLAIPTMTHIWMSLRYCKQILTDGAPNLGYFLAGGMAGVVSRTATAPLDRLRVYLIAQTSVRDAASNVGKGGSIFRAVGLMMKPLTDATKELWRAGGIRSLFAGNGLNVAKVMPESAIKFGAYEASKRMFASLEGHDDTKNLLPVSQFLAGGIGGMVSQCCVYPLDTLKFRMQCEIVEGGLRGNQLIAATAKKMWATNGVYGYFRGLPLGLIGMFPYAALDLMTFEYLKQELVARKARLLHCHEDDAPLNNFTTGAIGAFSGALSASIVYPLNVLRTRLQAQGTTAHKPTYTGILDAANKTLKSEGIRGFYRGLSPNLLKVAPSVSISYIVYENSKRLFGLN